MAFSNPFSVPSMYTNDDDMHSDDRLDLMTSGFMPDQDIKYRSLDLSFLSSDTDGPRSKYDLMGGMNQLPHTMDAMFTTGKDAGMSVWRAESSETVPPVCSTLSASHFAIVGRLGTASSFMGQMEDLMASQGASVERTGPFRLQCKAVVSTGLLIFDLALLSSEEEGLVVEFKRMQGDSVAAQRAYRMVRGLFVDERVCKSERLEASCTLPVLEPLEEDLDSSTKAMLEDMTVELLAEEGNSDLQICTLHGLLTGLEQPSDRVMEAVKELATSKSAEVRQMALRVLCKHGHCNDDVVETAVRELVRVGQRHVLGGVLAAMEERADLRADGRLEERVNEMLQMPQAVY